MSDETFLLLFTTGLEFELMFPTEIINMLIISNSNVILLLVHVWSRDKRYIFQPLLKISSYFPFVQQNDKDYLSGVPSN